MASQFLAAQGFEIVTGQKSAFHAFSKWRRVAGVVVLLGVAGVAQQNLDPVQLTGQIVLPGVHGRMDHLSADLRNGRLFVAAAGNDTVEVINVRTNAPIAEIREVSEPNSVVFLKSANRIFVTNRGDGSLRFFDGSTLKALGSLHLGTDPGTIRVDTTRHRVYVGYGDGAIAVLDSAGKQIDEIALKAHPESFQIAENQRRLWVNLPDSHAVSVIDTAKLKVIADWPVPDAQDNFAMAIDEEKRRIFIACRRPAELVVLDMDSGRVVNRLPSAGDVDDLFYDPIHARVYAVGGGGQLAIYTQQSADQYKQIDPVATAVGARTGLFVAEWNRFFVAVRDFASHPAEIRMYEPR